jgi:hypothetical protein
MVMALLTPAVATGVMAHWRAQGLEYGLLILGVPSAAVLGTWLGLSIPHCPVPDLVTPWVAMSLATFIGTALGYGVGIVGRPPRP